MKSKSCEKIDKVDVVITTLNSESVLSECLESVRSNIPFNRIIIVDGGSKDRTLEIAKKYGCDIYFCKGSLGESRMLGISKVSTNWFIFIDSDIVVNSKFFDGLCKYINDDVGAVQGMALPPDKYEVFDPKNIQPKELSFYERGYTNCTLIRTDLVRDVDLKNVDAYEDWKIKDHILKKGYKWLVVPVPVKHYHDYKGNISLLIKARWNGAGIRKIGFLGIIYLSKWFFGILVKKPIMSQENLNDFIWDVKYFFNTFVGFVFREKYQKIQR